MARFLVVALTVVQPVVSGVDAVLRGATELGRRSSAASRAAGNAPASVGYMYANPYAALAAAETDAEFFGPGSAASAVTDFGGSAVSGAAGASAAISGPATVWDEAPAILSSAAVAADTNRVSLSSSAALYPTQNAGTLSDADSSFLPQDQGDIPQLASGGIAQDKFDTNLFLKGKRSLFKAKSVESKAKTVSMAVCKLLADDVKAAKCTLVTEISGFPEGCECQLSAASSSGCPATDIAMFTATTPDAPAFGVQLCMYWAAAGGSGSSADAAAEAAKTKAEMTNTAQKMVRDSVAYAAGSAARLTQPLWAEELPTGYGQVADAAHVFWKQVDKGMGEIEPLVGVKDVMGGAA